VNVFEKLTYFRLNFMASAELLNLTWIPDFLAGSQFPPALSVQPMDSPTADSREGGVHRRRNISSAYRYHEGIRITGISQ
jgi:hypothetical protein